ncbi:MAG: GntR family transcriptional regulator [Phycisphaerae bacterium]|nr:GntR family transcriptional regulator [Phycisphaerae bacterium]
MSSAETTYKSKAVKLSQTLLRDIYRGNFIPGTRLPTQDELARKYGASRPTVRRALKLLAQKNQLVKEPQKGAVVPFGNGKTADLEQIAFENEFPNDSSTPVVTVLFFIGEYYLAPGRYENELFGLLSGKITKHGMAMRVQWMNPQSDHVKTVKELARRKPPVVATYTLSLQHFPLVQYLNRRGIPCLHLFPNLAENITPCLRNQDEGIIRRQVEHLVKLGHRRVAYLHDVDNRGNGFWTQRNQLDIFYRLCLEYKLDVQPDWVRYSGSDWLRDTGGDGDALRREVKDIMTKPGRKPTAFIINDEHVNPTYAALRECGFVPGKDISVVGTDDRAWAKHVDPPLTSVRLPRAQSADVICDMISDVIAGRNPGVRYLDAELVVRNSTCPVPTERKT